MADAEALHVAPKVAPEEVVRQYQSRGWLTTIAFPVWTMGTGIELELKATRYEDGLIEISLTRKRPTLLIRKWSSHTMHRNPDGVRVASAHKKYPTRDAPAGRWAYEVDDIDPFDVQDALEGFMMEENIELLPAEIQ